MKEVWPRTLETRVTLLEDDRFLASHTDFAEWAQGKKQLRMEFFLPKDAPALSDSDGWQ
jgi:deoxyribodipyrimidine photolyase-related protein